MLNREKINGTISKLGEIAERYGSAGISLPTGELTEYAQDFDVKVLVVGAFNAGKTSLINRLMDRENFLKEQQSPTTAIAAEIRYSEDEMYYGIRSDGSRRQLDISEINDTEGFSSAQFSINAPTLRQFSDYTIVDTPGFDSNVDSHNAALSTYISKASAYLLVIDAEDGTVSRSALAFVNEISRYTNNIAVLINKCDKMTPANVEAVKCSVCDTLELAGFDLPVECVSKFDEDLSAKIATLLDGFGAQKMYERVVGQRISIAAQGMASDLTVLKQTASVNTYDYDVQISMYDTAIRQITETFSVRCAELESSAGIYTNEIIDAIRRGLLGKTDALAQAALYRNENAMKSIIAETVRCVVNTKLREFSVSELDSMMRNLDLTGITDYEASRPLAETVISLADNTKELMANGLFNIIDNQEKAEKFKKGKNIYQKLSGLLFIATDFIAPWLELCIVLLPDIAQIFARLFGESDKEKLAKQIESVIIPQVTAGIYEPVSNAVTQSCDQLIAAAKENLNAAVNSKKLLLTNSREMRQHDLDNYEKLISDINRDIPLLIKLAAGEEDV